MERIEQWGQTTIEYLLLVGVLFVLFTAVVRNRHFQKFLGKDGEFFQRYSKIIEYHYRHGRKREGLSISNQNYRGDHDTYKDQAGKSNFVIPLGKYPNQ